MTPDTVDLNILMYVFCRYEKAICEYEKCLDVFQVNNSNEGTSSDLSSTLSSAVLNFLVNEVSVSSCTVTW